MGKTKKNQLINNLLIVVVAFIAFFYFIGTEFKSWTNYHYIGTAVILAIIITSAARIIKAIRTKPIEEPMPARKEIYMPSKEILEDPDFNFPFGDPQKNGALPRAGSDFVSTVRQKIDHFNSSIRLGAEELRKNYQEISKMELEINQRAKELYEQWTKLRAMKRIIEVMLRTQKSKEQEQDTLPKGW